MRSGRTISQACQVHCALLVNAEVDGSGKIFGDKHDPAYRGYSCTKGREEATVHALPPHMLQSRKRMADGVHVPVASTAVLAEVADRIGEIVARQASAWSIAVPECRC